MPILPPTSVAPFDTVESALEVARVLVNDAMLTISGEVLTDTAPFTQTLTNSGWRRAQMYAANKGYTAFKQETILQDCPVCTNLDPASQCSVSWTAYFDGNSYHGVPVLPSNFMFPLKIWERQSGTNDYFNDPPMECMVDGLPTTAKTSYNYFWEWRNQTIYFPGSLLNMDFRVLYSSYFPDFLTVGAGTPNPIYWYQQQIPLMYCQNALAKFIAYEFSKARGSAQAATFLQEAQQEMDQLFNRDMRMKQRTNVRRQPRSNRNYRTYGLLT